MPRVAWFASFIFLGLSVSIGLLVYLLLYRRKDQEEEKEIPPELQELEDEKQEKESLKDLERKYGKKG